MVEATVSVVTVYNTIPTVNDVEKEALENITETGENPGNQHFLFSRNFYYFS